MVQVSQDVYVVVYHEVVQEVVSVGQGTTVETVVVMVQVVVVGCQDEEEEVEVGLVWWWVEDFPELQTDDEEDDVGLCLWVELDGVQELDDEVDQELELELDVHGVLVELVVSFL